MISQSFIKALEYELMREQANALGRAGSKLESALQNYHNFIAQFGSSDTTKIAALLDDIAAKMWALALQRELIGFHHDNIEWISDTFDIPTAVLGRLGARPPTNSKGIQP